jgi:adenylate cyclase
MERRLAAIMAGDVVGYSRMMAEDESATYNQLRAALDDIVQPALERRGGRAFKNTGDGFLAAFPSVNEALDAAIDIQNGFATCTFQLRIGLNLGDVIEEAGDVFGDGVNIAARLEAMAEPGSIYVSAAVVRSADKNRNGLFESLGRRQVKNMPEAIEVYAIRPQHFSPAAGAGRTAWRIRRWAAAAAGAGLMAAIATAGLLSVDVDWRAAIAEQLQGPEQLALETTEAGTRPAVAVLPFDNLSGDPAQAYFTDGLTEDIITELARNRELLVIARNSTFALRDRSTDIREVGAILGAGYVVEGSARRSGDRLRVVAQLIDANTGIHRWSRSYDRQVGDVFDVQADLTAEIVASLVSYVRQAESEAAADRPTENLQAYDLVLRARDRYKHGSSDGRALLAARTLYQRAIELDPDYAAAHAYLGMTHIVDQVEDLTGEATGRDLEVGLDEARQAIQLEPDLPLGYQVLSFGLAASRDYKGSMRAGERAVELNPGDPDSLMALAKAQVRFGAYAEAVANAERARRLHPMAPKYYAYVHGQALYAADRTDEADEILTECLLSTPSEPNCLRIRAAVQVRQERLSEARETMAKLVKADGSFSLAAEAAYRRFGDSPLMERYLSDLARAQAPKSASDRSRIESGAT